MNRESFEQTLEENPYDEVTHKVFADWLDERGCPDEAEFHRGWTKEWQTASDYLHALAISLDLSYPSLIGAAEHYVNHAVLYDLPERVWEVELGSVASKEEFWTHYETVMKTKVHDKHAIMFTDDWPYIDDQFDCPC